MTTVRTGRIPAIVLSLLSIGILVFAGIDYGFFVPLAFALLGWAGVWLIRRGRVALGRLCWTAVGIGVLWLVSTLIWIGVHHVQSLKRELPPSCNTLVVLGTRLAGGAPSLHLQMRLDAAIEAAGRYPDAVVIATGGIDTEETISEAQAMAAYLERKGIDAGRIILEPQATSTYENLIYSRPLAQGEDIVVVTSGFHTLRTGLLCRWMGWDVVTVGSPTPWAEGLHWWVRECLALWKDIALHLLGRQ